MTISGEVAAMTNSPELQAALDACASEPIHIPGAIQNFGALVCLDQDLQYVQQVSSNIAQLLNLPVEECLKAAGTQLLGKVLIAQLRDALDGEEKIAGAFIATVGSKKEQQRVHVNAFRTGTSVVVELEPVEEDLPENSPQRHRLPIVNDWLDDIIRSQSPTQLLDKLVTAVRSFTGYDRVLVYKFDANFNGAVIAESRADFLAPFLGHHFPAHDIPPQARAMYEFNPVRVIADSRGSAVSLVPQNNPETGQPLDLSLGDLRAVSPVHQQYLQNMGVSSAVSVAIFSDAGLWGIVSCHCENPKPMPLLIRETTSTLTQAASQRLFLLYARAEGKFRSAVQSYRESFIGGINRAAPDELLRDQAAGWRKLLDACGLAFSHRGSLHREGNTPAPKDIEALTDWLGTQVVGLAPWATSSLVDSGYGGSVDMNCGCGVLAMPLATDSATKTWLLFFRPEKKRTIEWGGKPEEVIVDVENQPRLSPRSSFTTWKEVVRGSSEPWQPAEQLAIRDLGSDLMVAISSHEITRLNTDLQNEQDALAQANERLRQLALTDPLTGAGNRQKTENDIDSALNNAQRHDNTFSLLLFDIDKFKHLNDNYGHNLGDHVLKSMVQRVGECLRESDSLGRWGGEEFVVLMPNTDSSGAQLLAERLLKQVESTDFGLDEKVTISIGVAEWHPDDDRPALVARADDAMYEAKESGRNRVCVSKA